MSAARSPGLFAAAHMAECRRTAHDAALLWRREWQAFRAVGAGWHRDAQAARQHMRDRIRSARFYKRGTTHYAAIAKATEGGQA